MRPFSMVVMVINARRNFSSEPGGGGEGKGAWKRVSGRNVGGSGQEGGAKRERFIGGGGTTALAGWGGEEGWVGLKEKQNKQKKHFKESIVLNTWPPLFRFYF